MIVGISGKINSGKDLIGSIIQYLTSNYNDGHHTFEQYLKDIEKRNDNPEFHKFQIKKFADALKDSVCLFIGCTRKQLEDREFKEKELGEEWWYYKVNESLHSYKGQRNSDDIRKHGILIKLTPRKILQLLGTEAGRKIIHPNIWVNALMSSYTITKSYKGVILDKGKFTNIDFKSDNAPSWVITDMRFSNELDAVKSREGITIRVNREPKIKLLGMEYTYKNGSKEFVKTVEHESETALDDAQFDYTIHNDGTIEELMEAVKSILRKEEISC